LVEKECDDIAADSMVRTGSPDEDIVADAKEMPADMIVISTHGRTGFKHVLVGSVAEQVIRRAPWPVLVVREKENASIIE
jgi:universal stress protein A